MVPTWLLLLLGIPAALATLAFAGILGVLFIGLLKVGKNEHSNVKNKKS